MSAHILIDRMLSEGNYRMAQNMGTDGRGYNHALLSKMSIERAMEASDTGSALLVGPGGCNDIPLEIIATRFDTVHAVELDVEATKNAVMRLPANLRSKVQVDKMDITGGIGDRAQAISDHSFTPQAYDRAVTSLELSLMDHVLPPISSKEYDFVCSHLVASQLLGVPFSFLDAIRRQRFGSSNRRYTGNDTVESVQRTRDMPLKHIEQLARVVASGGVVHFADTYVKDFGDKKVPLLDHSAIHEKLKEHFDLVGEGPPDGWYWDATPSVMYVVGAYLLRKKELQKVAPTGSLTDTNHRATQ